MINPENRPIGKRKIHPLRIFFAREGPALFVGISVLAGTTAFFALVIQSGTPLPMWWGWLALVAAILVLPKAYKIVKPNSEPYVIRFAQAFRIGFWSAWSLFSSNLLELSKSMRKWRMVRDEQ